MKELNVYVDNKPGRLKAITNVLSEKKINIRAITIQSNNEFGSIKMIVDRPKEAYLELSNKGFSCALKEIIAIHVIDKPGGLNDILGIFSTQNINIKNSFAFIIESGKNAVICVEVDDIEKNKKILNKANIKILEDSDLYNL